MGENTSNRPARLIGAVISAAAAGLLLTSCASLAGAATPSASAPAETASAPAPVVSTSAPATEQTASPDPTASAAKGSVQPFVTSSVWDGNGIDVGAVVPEVVETGGTCTARAERDGDVVEQSGPAVAASSYTGCPQLVLKGSSVTAGTWTVTVSYSSDASEGTSKPVSVTVK